MERGHAYQAEGYVYYAIDSWPDYGALSALPREAMLPIANDRGNVPDLPGKRDPLDFVLWQPSAADEPSWPSPWGAGRPGWHIECSAMSIEYLGPRFEIHGGGGDLVFPHHESEIAQSEGATGERPFVEWWMHAGMLRFADEKMSKSLGNLVLVRDLLASYPGDAIRHYLISHHYRHEVDLRRERGGSLRPGRRAAAPRRVAWRRRSSRSRRPWRIRQRSTRWWPSTASDSWRRWTTTWTRRPPYPELHALAAICLSEADPALRAQAGWMVRELGARILGLRLATVPSVAETSPIDEAVPA